MKTSWSLRSGVLWVALLAVLVMSVAPAISQALRFDKVAGWAEVCSFSGAKWVQLDPASTDPAREPAPTPGIEHCPYCAFHVTALGLPPAGLAVLPLLVRGHEVPRLFLAAPRTPFAWRAALARAPPSLT